MKYKLINIQTKEEHLDCEEIEIDGYKYYINSVNKDFKINENSIYKKWKLGVVTEVNEDILEFEGEFIDESNLYKIICSNNPNIDISKIVDDELTICTNNHFKDYWKKEDGSKMKGDEISASMMTNMLYETSAFIAGYNKSQETYPFSDKDMIDFYEWCDTSEEAAIFWRRNRVDPDMSGNHWKKIRENRERLLKLWKEQRPKIIYYE